MESQFDSQLLARIDRCGVIAVLVVDEVRHAVPLAQALVSGGVDVMELTLRTSVAIDALRVVRSEVPKMLAGIGTILSTDQVHAVAEAGASFGVAPGTNPRVIQAAQGAGLPFAPGIATPSDLETALECGCREVKFFPAEPSGGLAYLKSLAAPYAHLGVRYIPLGGMHAENLGSYLADPLILAVGGSWLAPRDLIMQENWSAISQRAASAAETARDVRPGMNRCRS